MLLLDPSFFVLVFISPVKKLLFCFIGLLFWSWKKLVKKLV